MNELKPIADDPDSGSICPECGKEIRVNEGCSIASAEGSFFTCPYCGKSSVLIHPGAGFMFSGTMYRISEYPVTKDQPLIPCIETGRENPSKFYKPSPAGYRYFSRVEIVRAMADYYREDL